MTDTADHLERLIETQRANVEDTLEKLKDRLSVDQVVDDIGQAVGLRDLQGTLAVAGRQVRENPLALGLIGIGLAWLLIGRGGSEQRQPDAPGRHGDRPHRGEGDTLVETIAGGAAEVTGRASALAQDLADRVGHAASGVTDRVKDLGTDAANRMHAGSLVRQTGRRIERHPLLFGGIALIAGAVIGAALPRTRTEDSILGDTRDRLLQEAREVTQSLKDRTTEAAQRSYDAAVKAAEDEGLAPLADTPAAGRMETVAAAAMDRSLDQAALDRNATNGASDDSMGTGVRTNRGTRSRT